MRKAFGIMSAIIILLLVSSLLVVVMKVSFVSVKHTVNSYMIQRAQLFMQSVIENSILAIEGYDRNKIGNCLRYINFIDEDGVFEANVTVLRYYCYDSSDCPCSDIVSSIKDKDLHGYVLLKVRIESNTSNPKVDKKILLEKTTLQRP